MRITEKKTYIRDAVVKILCDWCGAPVEERYDYYSMSFDLKYEYSYSAWGDYWPEEKWEIDLCKDCIMKLKDLMLSNGITIKYKDDYH